MKRSVIGILAHVDAGKTTLAEALLYTSGKIRKQGRVDSGSTTMDSDILERERGITIFSSQAVFNTGDFEVCLLDTPGHVDFSAETERTLGVLDYAVLVISGLDGVQSHTKTLWKLLSVYNIPVFIFVTKMDFARLTKTELMDGLINEFGASCIDFSSPDYSRSEELAVCSENMLDEFLSGGSVSDEKIKEAILKREVFPCFFGSGLKLEGISGFMDLLNAYTVSKSYPEQFGARVFKITHDSTGAKITHLKITGGELKVRDTVTYGEYSEKIAQIRIYSGAKFAAADSAPAGSICAVTGLENTRPGMGLGIEEQSTPPVLEPVMSYRIVLPSGTDAQTVLPKLKALEEEDPLLHITWHRHIQEIHAELMGEVQAEILKSIIAERYKINAEIDSGKVLYKETVSDTVEGVGHYEPLRHYAEVHIIIEPLPRGSGIQYSSSLSEDVLDRNWQRLILTNMQEKQHLGVLTGSPLTDVKLTLAGGRAHLKHTEGGDFRQAVYRAIRQGLMQAKSVLLEPFYSFILEVPLKNMGRAISDLKLLHGSFEEPETHGDIAIIKGKCPVVTLNGYAGEVASYTSGKGRLQYIPAGYDVCHNSDEVIKESSYDPTADLDNTPDSVFCAHGAGFNVKWDKVKDYMHIESCLQTKKAPSSFAGRRNFSIDEKELEAIMAREFGTVKYDVYRPKKPARPVEAPGEVELTEKKNYVIVDGYNVIFAWEDLKELAKEDLSAARERLIQILCNYAAFTKYEVILVFDAYNNSSTAEKRENVNNIHVVFTKENEIADVYIEKIISEIGKNEKVRIVTSDNLIKLTAVQYGVLRVNADDFEKEVCEVQEQIREYVEAMKLKIPKNGIIEIE